MRNDTAEEESRHSSAQIPYSFSVNIIPDHYPYAAPHWHGEFEICRILEGNCLFRRYSDSFTASEGDLIVVAPNTVHSVYPGTSERMSHDVLIFPPSLITGSGGDRVYSEFLMPIISGESVIRAPIGKDAPMYKELTACFEALKQCAADNCAQSDLLFKSELLRFFWLLFRSGAAKRNAVRDIRLYNMILPAVKYAELHFRESICVEDLSSAANISRSYFMKIFKNVMGISAADYIINLRINSVCRELCSGDMRITDIAFANGFSNISNFNRQFLKIAGCTPGEYRKKSKAGI